ncbi:MAG: hypothetical protein IKE42_28420 [Aquamicrobium sp.]|nr:hypothetical protein [Aquamicrobium sp.]
MQLKIGKKYRRRDGTGPVEIKRHDKNNGDWPFFGSDGHTYTETGIWSGRLEETQLDLVAEWVEPAPIANVTDPQPVALGSEDRQPRLGLWTIGSPSGVIPLHTLPSIRRDIGIELIRAGHEAAGIYLIKGKVE